MSDSPLKTSEFERATTKKDSPTVSSISTQTTALENPADELKVTGTAAEAGGKLESLEEGGSSKTKIGANENAGCAEAADGVGANADKSCEKTLTDLLASIGIGSRGGRGDDHDRSPVDLRELSKQKLLDVIIKQQDEIERLKMGK